MVYVATAFLGGAVAANAQVSALLLFDAKTSTKFSGCLNCVKHNETSVCNKYGTFGSKYEDSSIWNRHGDVGSKHADDSPWNKYGEGLIVVDSKGDFQGHFTLSRYARWGQSRVPMVQDLLALYDAGVELDNIRDMLCD